MNKVLRFFKGISFSVKLILLLIVIIIAIIAVLITFLYLKVDFLSSNSVLEAIAVSILASLIFSVSYTLLVEHSSLSERTEELTRVRHLLTEIENQGLRQVMDDVSRDVHLRQFMEIHEKEIEQLVLSKQQLEVEKQKLELERQQQSLEWQKEAVMLTEVSPRAAIIIAWLGLEQEIQRAIMALNPLNQEVTFPTKGISWSIAWLQEQKQIDKQTSETLKKMSDLRNRVVHGLANEEEITKAIALDFVQKAINIALSISLKKSGEPWQFPS